MQRVCVWFEAAFVELYCVWLSDKCTTTKRLSPRNFSLCWGTALQLLLHFNGYFIDLIGFPFFKPRCFDAARSPTKHRLLFLYSYQAVLHILPVLQHQPFLRNTFYKHLQLPPSLIDIGSIHRFLFLLPLSALFALCKAHNNGDDGAKQQQDLFLLVTISALTELVELQEVISSLWAIYWICSHFTVSAMCKM